MATDSSSKHYHKPHTCQEAMVRAEGTYAVARQQRWPRAKGRQRLTQGPQRLPFVGIVGMTGRGSQLPSAQSARAPRRCRLTAWCVSARIVARQWRYAVMQCRCMCRAMCRETALSQIHAEPLCLCASAEKGKLLRVL